MEKQTKPVSTFHPEDGHFGKEEHEQPGIVRRRYHGGNPDTSGENGGFEPDGPTVLHQHDKRR